jgi:5-(carboxyamino)imidazole ribonucleotide mutase
MPNGVPVATVALNAAKNAGILAAEIIGTFYEDTSTMLASYKVQMQEEVLGKAKKIQANWNNNYDV